MHTNFKRHFIIQSEQIILAPYLRDFVKTYHGWMQSDEILYHTGSEPLTLDEEYENQLTWLEDPTKYTFIILKLKDPEEKIDFNELETLCSKSLAGYLLSVADMVGDINLFFHEYLEEHEAEINIMIGEQNFRGKGIAQKVLNMMMEFGYTHYNKVYFIAKIKNSNIASINLFKKMGFAFQKMVESFNEVHYIKKLENYKHSNFEQIIEYKLK